MNVISALKEIMAAEGGTSTAKTVSGVLHDIAVAKNPLVKLTISACTDSDTLMGTEKASDLQSNIKIEGNKVTGYSKYVTGYTAYSTSPELDHGNFVALHAEVPGETGVTISVTMSRTAELESDGNVVARVADKDTQTLVFTASKDGLKSVSKTLVLRSLRLEAAPAVAEVVE